MVGYGAVTPLGRSVAATMAALRAGQGGTRRMPDWNRYGDLACQVGAPAELRDEKQIPRQFRRTMSRMSIFAVQAVQQALAQAGLDPAGIPDDLRCGCVMGSTTGSPEATTDSFENLFTHHDYALLGASEFFRCIAHTVTLNVAQFLGVRGVVLATAGACASGLQAVGAAYDLIRCGRQDLVVCGGAEEIHPTVTASFDILYAGSTHFNDAPERTPRPFDAARDGLVCGEGAGVLVLEEYGHARRRQAPILAEILGYHTCGNGRHVSQSDEASMAICMGTAVAEAGLAPSDIGYVNAHATGTPQGDAAEAAAIRGMFGEGTVPVSSLKGHLGHTLGASGAIELIAAVEMMREGLLLPTRNLAEVAPDCQGLDHVREIRRQPVARFLKNSFAFGGINAAMVCGLPDAPDVPAGL